MKRRRKNKLKNRLNRRNARLADKALRPTKTADEVFVFPKSKLYHAFWCDAVNGSWLAGSLKMKVISHKDSCIQQRSPCLLCLDIWAKSVIRGMDSDRKPQSSLAQTSAPDVRLV